MIKKRPCFHFPAPDFGDKICPRIVGLSKFLKKDFHKILSASGLFAGQDHVLLYIEHNEGITASGLARELNLSLATISVSIKRLEKSGFIEKRADEKDARITHIYTTKKADNVSELIRKRTLEQEKVITNGMTDYEKAELLRLLDKALNNAFNDGGFADEKE